MAFQVSLHIVAPYVLVTPERLTNRTIFLQELAKKPIQEMTSNERLTFFTETVNGTLRLRGIQQNYKKELQEAMVPGPAMAYRSERKVMGMEIQQLEFSRLNLADFYGPASREKGGI